ncbi:MAG: radical SAM protein [Candidatus Auribacter fodinae]|jgi:hypothetical protein|uniref:Radical SAM protein n=1 Tax=Candidatus Auribacter fodinae TaxID=2093366 RepID=A0A3A4R693_9BACT|nr:MAG: radical SAM protein [Candidatus Auribacter fodinae]
MKNNVLLVNPWIHDFAAYDLWCKPLSLLTIASWLRSAGAQVSLIDCLDRFHPKLLARKPAGWLEQQSNDYYCGKFHKLKIPTPELLKSIDRTYYQYGIPENLFIEQLKSIPKPDVCMITTMMTYWYPGTLRTIELIKEVYPDVPINVGGIYPTLHYDHACAALPVDYVHKGAPDGRLCAFLEKYIDLPQPLSLYYPLIEPAFDLVHNTKSISLMTSVGCPFVCTYCASRYLQPTYKRLAVDEVIRRFEMYAENYGTEIIAFYDDALLYHAEQHIMPILDKWNAAHSGISFHTPNGLHARFITEPLANTLYRSGFKTLRLSLETTSSLRQASTGGKIFTDEIQRSIEILYNAGFKPENLYIYLLCGLPDQTEEEILADIHLTHKMGARIELASFTPIPHTTVWDTLAAQTNISAQDPLLHNKAVFFLTGGALSLKSMRALRNYVSKLNSSIA